MDGFHDRDKVEMQYITVESDAMFPTLSTWTQYPVLAMESTVVCKNQRLAECMHEPCNDSV